MSSMFCFQCQEAAKNQGCTARGVCGKTAEVAALQDLLGRQHQLERFVEGWVDRSHNFSRVKCMLVDA